MLPHDWAGKSGQGWSFLHSTFVDLTTAVCGLNLRPEISETKQPFLLIFHPHPHGEICSGEAGAISHEWADITGG
jgi:hypothetical protein